MTDYLPMYVSERDADAGTVTFTTGYAPEPVEAFDGDIAHLLYACLVRQGVQPPVEQCWPEDGLAQVAGHFYSSLRPRHGASL